MAKLGLYLDTRRVNKDGTSLLKLLVRHKGKTSYISLQIKLKAEQWDKDKQKVINHPNKAILNSIIATKYLEYEMEILELLKSGKITGLDAFQIKDELLLVVDSEYARKKDKSKSFAVCFMRFVELKKGRTKDIYLQTYKKLSIYSKSLENLMFEDITKEWLLGFDNWLEEQGNSKNGRNLHLRNIRAVFNEAIDNETTNFYPFRKLRIKNVQTAKRSLSVEQLRILFAYPIEPWQERYLDIFKLVFFLIGINMVDLLRLTEIIDGRIEYSRAKTKRFYSIKVEQEALEIINKYKGEKTLLEFGELYADYTHISKKTNLALQKIGVVELKGKGGQKFVEPAFPKITLYWARHSWATIASSLDIPKETIAQALGHGGNTVTDIYIDFDRNKIDEANRRVIDWVLYGKK